MRILNIPAASMPLDIMEKLIRNPLFTTINLIVIVRISLVIYKRGDEGMNFKHSWTRRLKYVFPIMMMLGTLFGLKTANVFAEKLLSIRQIQSRT